MGETVLVLLDIFDISLVQWTRYSFNTVSVIHSMLAERMYLGPYCPHDVRDFDSQIEYVVEKKEENSKESLGFELRESLQIPREQALRTQKRFLQRGE